MAMSKNFDNDSEVCDEYHFIKRTLTDLQKIVDNIDDTEGRNDALRAYIYALRDLQNAHTLNAYEENNAGIDAAHRRVVETFDELIAAQSRLNRELT
jgi:hypothetical protein